MDLTATIGSSSVGCSLTIKALRPLRRFARVKHLLFGFFFGYFSSQAASAACFRTWCGADRRPGRRSRDPAFYHSSDNGILSSVIGVSG